MWFLSPFIRHTIAQHPILRQDLEQWQYRKRRRLPAGIDDREAPGWLLRRYPEYRSVFYYRLSHLPDRDAGTSLLLRLLQRMLPPLASLAIHGQSIGSGLYVHHGLCTIINAQSIGRNFWVSQQVTVGESKGGRPVIGDEVHITAGAKVFGAITIGDRVVVGANAVVNKDVPPDCTVVGIPARIVRRNGERVNEALGVQRQFVDAR